MSATEDRIRSRRDGHVAWIEFSNPARLNAMSLAMWQGLSDHLAAFASDAGVRVVVLAGAGGRAFVSGADISEFDSQRGSADAVAHYNAVSEAAEEAVAGFPKPIIAAIDGYCLGGGVGLAIGCDLRICSDTSSFGIPAGRLGLGYAYDGIAKLVDTIGPAATAEIFLTADRFDAHRALAMGLVNRVVGKDRFQTEIEEITGRIATNAPLTMAAFKAALLEHRKAPDRRDRQHIAEMVRQCYASDDYAEGRAAFQERRTPDFVGR